MPRFLIILATTLLLLIAGCTSSSDVPNVSPNDAKIPNFDDAVDEGADPQDIVSGVGTVKYIDLEGGFYGIETEQGERLNPQNLDAEYQQDGLRVRFRAEKQDVMTTQMWGTPVRILEILTLDD